MATRKRRKKKRNARKKLLLFSAELLLLFAIVAGIAIWKQTFGRIRFDKSLTGSEAGINEDLAESTLLTMEGYTNIALFGLDNRKSGSYDSGNSDAIMVASINNDTKKIRLLSVFRDTYLNVGKDTAGNDVCRKINAAYARGGVANAVRALNENLDLDIKAYMCVDWNALIEAIDALGGIEVTITEFEVEKINFYVKETAKSAGVKAKRVQKPGKQILDGVQATSYARIRYGDGLDMMRSSRQRIVLQAMIAKAKEANFAELAGVCNSVFDDIQTSLSVKDLLYLAKNIPDYELAATYAFPEDFVLKRIRSEECVVAADMSSNVRMLHEFLFPEDSYEPSSTVEQRSAMLTELTGVTASSSGKIDFSRLGDVVGAEGTAELWEKKTGEAVGDTESSEE